MKKLMPYLRSEDQRRRARAGGQSPAGREGPAGGVFTKQSHFAKTNPISRPPRDGRIGVLIVAIGVFGRDPARPSARSTNSRQAGSGLRRDRRPPWRWTPVCPRGAGSEYDSVRQESGPVCSPDLNDAEKADAGAQKPGAPTPSEAVRQIDNASFSCQTGPFAGDPAAKHIWHRCCTPGSR